MKIIEIEVNVSTNRSGSEVSEVIEVEIKEGLTSEQEEDYIEEEAKQWMFNNIEWSWKRAN